MPLRSRPGASPALEKALRAEVARVSKLPTDAERVRGVCDVLATLEAEHERLHKLRLQAVGALRASGLSYDGIARATGLSKTRVAQLVRETRRAT